MTTLRMSLTVAGRQTNPSPAALVGPLPWPGVIERQECTDRQGVCRRRVEASGFLCRLHATAAGIPKVTAHEFFPCAGWSPLSRSAFHPVSMRLFAFPASIVQSPLSAAW